MTRLFLALAALVMIGLGIAAGLAPAQSAATSDGQAERAEFAGWSKPDVVLLISGQQYGYIEPCGCTGLTNQKGGLMRRDTLLKSLLDRGWQVLPLDAGNQVRRSGAAQSALKFQFTVNALRQMEYRAVGFGPDDLRLPLGDLLAVITASLDDQGQSDVFLCANVNPAGFVAATRVVELAGMRIGITAVVGEAARSKLNQPDIETRPAADALREAVAKLKSERCNFVVCLAQADDQECHQLAQAAAGIDLIVAAAGAGEPKYQPDPIPGTKTLLIQTGQKGMYVGAVGLFAAPGAPPRLKYQRLPLDARYDDSPRMQELFAEYQRLLQEQGLEGLGLKPVRHVRGEFVGSEKCGDCHTRAFEKWQSTPHHNATQSIAEPTERATIPRHYDPECLSCHVTGWSPQGYFPFATGYLSLEGSKSMHGNGCENCHGPGAAHVAAENGEGDLSDEAIQMLRQQMRLELSKAEQLCIECHDLDNSPDFHQPDAFQKYWSQIEHPGRD